MSIYICLYVYMDVWIYGYLSIEVSLIMTVIVWILTQMYIDMQLTTLKTKLCFKWAFCTTSNNIQIEELLFCAWIFIVAWFPMTNICLSILLLFWLLLQFFNQSEIKNQKKKRIQFLLKYDIFYDKLNYYTYRMRVLEILNILLCSCCSKIVYYEIW